MQKMLNDYEQTIRDIEKRIEELKPQLNIKMPVKELHKLEWRIETLKAERLEMIHICSQIKEYLAPKADSPSAKYKLVSGGY